MHILVIGGAGYIGSHVVKELLKNNQKVTIFDDLSTGQEINLFPNAQFIKGSNLDLNALEEVMSQNVDGIVFLAGKKAVGESMENPAKYANTNLIGAINVLNSMLKYGVDKFIFADNNDKNSERFSDIFQKEISGILVDKEEYLSLQR